MSVDASKNEQGRGIFAFCAGLLLLGATAVISLLQISSLWSLIYGLILVAAVFLMGLGALHAGHMSRLFTAAGCVFLLDALVRLSWQIVETSGLAGKNEQIVWAEVGMILGAAVLEMLGVALVLGGSAKCRRDKETGSGRYKLAALCFALGMVAAVGLPGLIAMYRATDRSMAMGGIALASAFFFLVCLGVATVVRGSFREKTS